MSLKVRVHHSQALNFVFLLVFQIFNSFMNRHTSYYLIFHCSKQQHHPVGQSKQKPPVHTILFLLLSPSSFCSTILSMSFEHSFLHPYLLFPAPVILPRPHRVFSPALLCPYSHSGFTLSPDEFPSMKLPFLVPA